jgi:hypothetical protein
MHPQPNRTRRRRRHDKLAVGRRRRLAGLAGALLVAMIAAGCQTAATPNRQPSAAIDPCADRLHDICGDLLLYYAARGKLPDRIEDIRGADTTPLICPVSGRPYLYNPGGLLIPGLEGRLVLYDPLPFHSGLRWGIMAEPGGEGEPLALRVVPLLDKVVLTAERAARQPAAPLVAPLDKP